MKPIQFLTPIALLPLSSHASSLILAGEGGWNGFAMEAEIKSGFRPTGAAPGSLPEISTTDTGFLSIAPDVHAPGTTLNMNSNALGSGPLTSTIAPHIGLPKDISTGTVDVSFTIGTATTNDSFSFSINNTTSAELAMVDFGSGPEPVDAFFEASIRIFSFAPATIPGATIELPAIPDLGSSAPIDESMLTVFNSHTDSGPIAGFQTPGSPGVALPIHLVGGQSMSYTLNYSITTPFGTDPTVSYTLTGSALVPEPSTSTLVIMSLLVLRRRSRP